MDVKIKVTVEFGVSDSALEDAMAEYDELTVEGLIREIVDKAIAIAARPEVIFCSFGDMLRVPGSGRDLFSVRADGGDVRVVY